MDGKGHFLKSGSGAGLSRGAAMLLAAFMRAAQTVRANGSFSALADLASYAEINEFLAADSHAGKKRET